MTLPVALFSIAIAICIAFLVYQVRHYTPATRHAIAGAFTTLTLCLAVLVGEVARPHAITTITQAILFVGSLCFFVLEIRYWRADKDKILGGGTRR